MRLTVGKWAPQWLATRVDLKPTTRRGYEVALRSRILPEWGPVRLGDVSRHGIAEWVTRLTRAGLNGATVQHHHRVFSLLLAAAVLPAGRGRRPGSTGDPLSGLHRRAARRSASSIAGPSCSTNSPYTRCTAIRPSSVSCARR
jgi:hypothetical protein